MPRLTIQEIEQIATLARLALTDEEKQRYADDLSAVFGYIDQLNKVDTDAVAETCQVTKLEDMVREDVAIHCDEETKQKLVACFPQKTGKLLKVKAVFDS